MVALVENWLDERPELVVNCFGPGARSPNYALQKFHVRYKGIVPMVSNDGTCEVGALANAIAIFCGYNMVYRIMLAWKQMKLKFNLMRSCSNLTSLLHGLKDSIPMENAPKLQLQHFDKKKDMEEFKKRLLS